MSYEDIPTVPKTELLLTDTFEVWRDKFNQAVSSISDSVDVIIDTIAQIPQPETVAERYHASTSPEYGLSTDTLYGHVMASSTVPKEPSATGSIGSETSSFARGDHVHPFGKANIATTLETSRTIDGFTFNGAGNISRYGTVSTASATQAKTVTVTGLTSLVAGTYVFLKFTNTNTVNNPTLNVSSTGAKNIRVISQTGYINAQAGSIIANKIYLFIYDGTYWIMLNADDAAISLTSANISNTFNNLTTTGEYYVTTIAGTTKNAPLDVSSGWWVKVRTAQTTAGVQILQEARMHSVTASTVSAGAANVLIRCYNGSTWGPWEYSYAQFAG